MHFSSILVPAKSICDIRGVATKIRVLTRAKDNKPFPIKQVIESFNDRIAENDAEIMQVVEDSELPFSYADTDPSTGVIRLRNDCYEKAENQNKEALFTISHELGHSEMHRGVATLPRMDNVQFIPELFDSEVQADSFACELMVSLKYLRRNLKRLGVRRISDLFRIPEHKLNAHITRLIKSGDLKSTSVTNMKGKSQLEMNFK